MRIYRTDCRLLSQGVVIAWAASKRQAARDRAAFRGHGNDVETPPETKPVDLQITRAALVAWLNAHFNTDNG